MAQGQHSGGIFLAELYLGYAIKAFVAIIQANCCEIVDHFLSSRGVIVFANFPDGMQVMNYAFTNYELHGHGERQERRERKEREKDG